MKSRNDNWQEFREAHALLTKRWEQASQIERGVLLWHAEQARQEALAADASGGVYKSNSWMSMGIPGGELHFGDA